MTKDKNQDREQYKQALIELVGSRVVAYYPVLARRIGGVKAAVMLSQLIYWSNDKAVKDREGHWVYKSVVEFEEETGLTIVEQQTARKILTQTGIVLAELRGVPRIWRYQVNMDRLAEILMCRSIDGQSRSMANSLNGKPIERLCHSMTRPVNVDRQTDGTFTGKVTQLNRNFNITESQITSEITTTTTTQPGEQLPAASPMVVVVWPDGEDGLRQMGCFEVKIPEYIDLARARGWTERQFLDLMDALITKNGRDRACSLLRYRIENDTPSRYGYAQSPVEQTAGVDWYLSDATYARLLDAGLTEEQGSEADGLAMDAQLTDDEILSALSASPTPDAFLFRLRDRVGVV